MNLRESKLLVWGSLIIIASIVLNSFFEFKHPLSESSTHVAIFVLSTFSAAGVTLILLDLIEHRILWRFLEGISAKIYAQFAEAAAKISELLADCECHGLIRVLPPRQDKKRGKETIEVIQSAIRETKSLKIMCISGLDFFALPEGASASGGRFVSVIQDKIKKRDFSIQVMLLNPKSEAARLRNKIETYQNTKGNLSKDIEHAIASIKSLNNRAKKIIRHITSNELPPGWTVMTDKYLFFEPYHNAPTGKLRPLQKYALRD